MRFLLAVALPFAGHAAGWLSLTSPHFELLTDAGEKNGAQLLERLETVRHVFLESIGGKAPALPIRVFQFQSERDFRKFEPRRTVRGFHQGAPDRDYIAVVGSGEESLRAIRHEYMHLLLAHGSATLPMWLEEGTAELYSTLDLRASGALFGAPIAGHVRALNGGPEWVPGEAFFNAGRNAALLDHSNQAGMFYAQAWALAHMLNFAPAWRANMPRFVELIDQGTPALLAFEPAFGVSPSRALTALRNYVKGARFGTALAPMPPRPASDDWRVETLNAAQISLAQVELLIALGKSAEADHLLASLSGNPTPELETARGLQALARRDAATAKSHFLAAMRLGSTSAVPSFEYAMLLREERAPNEEVRKVLAEAVGRNPQLSEAHFILGLMAQKEGRHREAIASFEEATRVLPRQSYFWHARALSHHELRQPELARRSALRAAASATDTAQLEMAQGALELVNAAAPPAPSALRPAVSIPDAWNPRQGSKSVEGALEQIDCFGTAARFQIRPAPSAAPVRLWVQKPGDVLLKDASSITFSFACGPQQPRRVIVEYEPESGLPQSSTGRIVAIRFL